ncbi:MAG TPA: hypothetical protein VKQ36_05095, partial [Ktedonobacterales bacterium]|nr:hypothetical protein [Ktedonobacterales bacterium]
AAALLAAALVMRRPLTLTNLDVDSDDTQALIAALDALTPAMGATLRIDLSAEGGILTLTPGATRHAQAVRHINGDACIDSVPTLVAAACFAEGETHFEQVETLRLKESDRIGDLCAELQKAGADVTPLPDAIIVRGRPQGIVGGAAVDGHDDHRLVQALAIIASGSERGLAIANADAVAKSYPWFFDDLLRLGGRISGVS